MSWHFENDIYFIIRYLACKPTVDDYVSGLANTYAHCVMDASRMSKCNMFDTIEEDLLKMGGMKAYL